VFETFNSIADNFKRLRRLQELNIQGKLKNERLSPAQERKSKEFKRDILTEVKSRFWGCFLPRRRPSWFS